MSFLILKYILIFLCIRQTNKNTSKSSNMKNCFHHVEPNNVRGKNATANNFIIIYGGSAIWHSHLSNAQWIIAKAIPGIVDALFDGFTPDKLWWANGMSQVNKLIKHEAYDITFTVEDNIPSIYIITEPCLKYLNYSGNVLFNPIKYVTRGSYRRWMFGGEAWSIDGLSTNIR